MPGSVTRLGLIGAGRWGRNYIRTIAALDHIRLTMVASRNPETAALVPVGCAVVEHWRDIVDARDIDGIIVAAPPAAHADILEAAIERLKPALVEKPLVTSPAQANRIRRMLDRHPVPVMVDHVHLFHPAFRALCREAARLGPLRAIHSSAGNHGPYRRDVSVLWDWGPHDLAMCLTVAPGTLRPIEARCLESRTVQGVRAERLALDLAIGDVPINIGLSTLDDRHRWFAASFDDGALVYRDQGVPLMRLAAGKDIHTQAGEEIPTPSEPPLTRAVLDFVAAIRQQSLDRSALPSGFDLGLAVVDVLSDLDAMLHTSRRDAERSNR